jgi:aminoglycoside phosphotransferase
VNAKRQIRTMTALPQSQRTATPQEPYRLAGHSGARLLLMRRDGGHAVRKTSGSPKKNERLLAQAELQRQFLFSGVAVPRIFETGIDEDGCAYFEMDYIPGRTLADMIATAMPFDPAPVEEALARLFGFLGLTRSGTVPAAAFATKIAQIAACDSEICRTFRAPIARAAERLADADWSGIPQTVGHGDLTLENILVSPERGVVFIDCDSCFASSAWLDAGKLFQDVAGHWCLRKLYGHAGPALVNAVQQMEMLKDPLRRLTSDIDAGLPSRLSQFAGLHLLRTLPYVRDTATADFVLKRLEKVLAS